MVRITHDLSSLLEHPFLPKVPQVCQLNSNDLGADFNNTAEVIRVHHRQSIKPADKRKCAFNK